MAVRHPAEAPTEGVASELHSIVRTATATAPGNPRGRRVGCIIARCLRVHAEKSPDVSTRGVVVEASAEKIILLSLLCRHGR